MSPFNPPTGAGAGRRRWMFGLGLAAVVCAAYVAGRSTRPSAVGETGAGARQVLYYVDPMHPAYRSDRPGKAPDCGMDLTPVYAGERTVPSPATSPDAVRLTPDQQQAVGLETEMVQTAPGPHVVNTAGRVMPDEALTYRVSAGVDGWVRRVFSERTGTKVKRDESLAAFYSKDTSAPQQAYIYALDSYERLKKTPSPPPAPAPPPSPPTDPLALATQQLSTTRDNLRFLGMGDAQIEELGRTRREIVDVHLTAPADGQILERHMALGQRFMKGEILYTIANLQRVWVLADVHAGDAALLDSAGKARIRMEGFPPLQAKVASAPPQFDQEGRTGKLRLEVNNPGGRLVPGMIVNVDLDLEAHSALTVDADAVIDSGTTTSVFIALGDGQYQLRAVETGWQAGKRVEIRAGLKAGERVVTAGTFLLDSESRMKNSANHLP